MGYSRKISYCVSDKEAIQFAKEYEQADKKVKYNQDGTINKTQFNIYVRKKRHDEQRLMEMNPIEAVEELTIKHENKQLTDEQIEKIKLESQKGNIPMEEVKKVLLYRYKDDPLYMAVRLFRDFTANTATGEFTPSPDFHQELMDMYTTHRKVAICAPRGHAKSTVTGFFYVMHQALFQKKRNIILVSATEDIAIRFLRDVKSELETNKQLLWLFGPQQSDKWSEKEIKLQNGCRIYAKGRGGQIRGLKEKNIRPDLIILDDLEDIELVRSELRRLDLEDWFNSDVMFALDPQIGQLIFIGTVLHEDSLLNRVSNHELYPDFTTKTYRAIQDDGLPLWPERFSLEYINKIKEDFIARGQLATFYMEFMNDPAPSEGATFKTEYIQYYDTLPTHNPIIKELFIDLAGGSLKKTADDTAMVVLATDQTTGDMYVEDYVAEKMGTDTDAMIKHIIRLTTQHNIRKIYIEKSVATNMLRASLDRKLKETRHHLVIEYVTPNRGSADRRGNMSDGKFQRIAQMEAPFKMGTIKLRKWQTKLVEQLLMFPRGQHDDVIDALSYGYQFGKQKKRFKKKQWVPTHRGGYLNREYVT